ncbi:MAG: glycosyltransferase, partial [Armatimonadota bacterium]
MADPASTQLDICIVSWRTRDLLHTCLDSVVGQPDVARIIVVDNASADGTVEMLRADFPTIHL